MHIWYNIQLTLTSKSVSDIIGKVVDTVNTVVSFIKLEQMPIPPSK